MINQGLPGILFGQIFPKFFLDINSELITDSNNLNTIRQVLINLVKHYFEIHFTEELSIMYSNLKIVSEIIKYFSSKEPTLLLVAVNCMNTLLRDPKQLKQIEQNKEIVFRGFRKINSIIEEGTGPKLLELYKKLVKLLVAKGFKQFEVYILNIHL